MTIRSDTAYEGPGETPDHETEVDPDLPAGDEEQPPSEPQPEAPPVQQAREPQIIQIPTSTMKRIKEEERQRGRAALRNELDTEARKLGFRSHDEMVRQIATSRRNPAPKQAAQPQPAASDGAPAEQRESPRKIAALERDVARLTDERKRANRRVADLEREITRLKAGLDSKDAELALRVAAARAGVQDVEYALHVLQGHLRGKSEEELRGFSEEKFFADTLRASHPYLYGVETRPANSSPALAAGRPPVPPRIEAPADGSLAPVDAKSLSREQYQELLRKRGITDPAIASFAG